MFGDLSPRFPPAGTLMGARVYRGTTSNFGTGGSQNKLTYDTVGYDTHGLWMPSLNVFSIKKRGFYWVDVHRRCEGNYQVQPAIYKNPSSPTDPFGTILFQGVSNVSNYDNAAMGIVLLESGDLVSASAWFNSSAPLTSVQNYFSIAGPF